MEAHALRPVPLGARKLGALRRLASDDSLVAAVRAGRSDAFEGIFERYHPQILSFCRHMLASREEGEDAVQHTFMAAYTDLVASDKPIQLRPWLYAIARNHCISVLRARRQQAPLEDVEPAVEGLAAEVQRRADLQDMLRDLARLPDDQRTALVLAEMGALTHEEIAGVLACPKEKVKALVFQARSSLLASRDARDTPCAEIREQLALAGGALRRAPLRRHLRECSGCREFRAEVRRQRSAIAVLLPVVPTAALKSKVLAAVGLGGTAAGGGGGAAAGVGAGATAVAGAGGSAGGGVTAILANAGMAKLVVAAAVAVGGTAGGVAAVDAIDHGDGGRSGAPANAPARGNGGGGATGTQGGSSFSPTRAYGEHAPGNAQGGVANGSNPKGANGRSGTAPGHAGTSPGQAGTSPGRAGTSPGQSGTSPGHSGSNPGRSGTSPGHSRTPGSGGSGRGGGSGGGRGSGNAGAGSGGGGGNSGAAPGGGSGGGGGQAQTAVPPE
jgi:RNA polymerase sigma factor (sigma-70 family)